MALRQLRAVLREFRQTVKRSVVFADDARLWALPPAAPGAARGAAAVPAPVAAPQISVHRRDAIIELAYLQGFLAWESFLEETFILSMMGRQAPRGRPSRRFVLPPNRKAALEMTAEGRSFASWEKADDVATRATRFFRNGHPYAAPLQARRRTLEQARLIRNAVAHRSEKAQEHFENIARNGLGGVLPPGLTVGAFLNTTRPGSAPPESFLEFYLTVLVQAAEEIVRT